MDHPDPVVTLRADPTGLTAARSTKLAAAVTTVGHHLRPWHPFVAAASTHPLHITVTAVDDPAPTVAAHLDADRAHLRLPVPLGLLQEPPGRLAARLLDLVVPALVTHAEHHPHPRPTAFWQGTEDGSPPTDDPEPGIQLGDVLDGDVLLVARHDGTPAGAESRERTLGDDLCVRLEGPGIAASDGAFTTDSAVCWTLELLHGD